MALSQKRELLLLKPNLKWQHHIIICYLGGLIAMVFKKVPGGADPMTRVASSDNHKLAL